jgi:hypothetical protein
MNWAYSRTVEGFFHLLARGQYDRLHPTDNLAQFVSQLLLVAKDAGGGFGWLYYLFAAVPVCFVWQTHGEARRWLLSLIAMLTCVGPVMIATLNPGPERFSVELLRPYYIAMYVVLAILTGLGLVILGSVMAMPAAGRHRSAEAGL